MAPSKKDGPLPPRAERKAKKEKRSAGFGRAERKAKKRAAEAQIPDFPAEDENENENGGEEAVGSKKRRRDDDGEVEEKLSKKRKGDGAEEVEVEGEGEKKSKKERKAAAKAAMANLKSMGVLQNVDAVASGEVVPEASSTKEKVEKDVEEKPKEEGAEGKKTNKSKSEKPPLENTKTEKKPKERATKFICFVGNLPFTATKSHVLKHFAKVKPKDIRLLTEKEPPHKSRGIAFIEFQDYDRMKTCLKVMHLTDFDDGISPVRKINVELTAGGGGNTTHRTSKIKEKNFKLNEQRSRRAHEEEKVKKTGEKRDVETTGTGDFGGIHPSRRGRLGMVE